MDNTERAEMEARISQLERFVMAQMQPQQQQQAVPPPVIGTPLPIGGLTPVSLQGDSPMIPSGRHATHLSSGSSRSISTMGRASGAKPLPKSSSGPDAAFGTPSSLSSPEDLLAGHAHKRSLQRLAVPSAATPLPAANADQERIIAKLRADLEQEQRNSKAAREEATKLNASLQQAQAEFAASKKTARAARDAEIATALRIQEDRIYAEYTVRRIESIAHMSATGGPGLNALRHRQDVANLDVDPEDVKPISAHSNKGRSLSRKVKREDSDTHFWSEEEEELKQTNTKNRVTGKKAAAAARQLVQESEEVDSDGDSVVGGITPAQARKSGAAISETPNSRKKRGMSESKGVQTAPTPPTAKPIAPSAAAKQLAAVKREEQEEGLSAKRNRLEGTNRPASAWVEPESLADLSATAATSEIQRNTQRARDAGPQYEPSSRQTNPRRKPRTPSVTHADRVTSTRVQPSNPGLPPAPVPISQIIMQKGREAPPTGSTSGLEAMGLDAYQQAPPTAQAIPSPRSTRRGGNSGRGPAGGAATRGVGDAGFPKSAEPIQPAPQPIAVSRAYQNASDGPTSTFSRHLSSTVSSMRHGTLASAHSSRAASPQPHNPMRGKDTERFFAFTGLTAELADRVLACINQIGQRAQFVECGSDTPPPSYVTHIVQRDRPRSLKALCGLAAGNWLCTPEYIEASLEAGFWLDEEQEGLLRAEGRPLLGKDIAVVMENPDVKSRLEMVVEVGGGRVAQVAMGQVPPRGVTVITSGDDLINLCLAE